MRVLTVNCYVNKDRENLLTPAEVGVTLQVINTNVGDAKSRSIYGFDSVYLMCPT